MSSSYPSSTCATHGSVNGSTQNSTNSPSSSSYSSFADQQALSTSRTAAYVADPTASHIQHRHASAQQSVRAHTNDMKAYLDEFDAKMAGYEK